MTRHSANKTIHLLALIVTAIAACACDWSADYWTSSYIQEYVEIDGFYFRKNGAGEEFKFISGHGKIGTFKDSGESKEWFDEICALNGDVTYNRKVHLIMGMPRIIAYTPDIVSIDVIAGDYYDTAHPVESSLNDCITIKYCSAAEYVEGDYKGNKPGISRKMLSDLTAKDLKILLHPECTLEFTVKPEELTLHTMNIKMRLTDGQEYTSEFKFDFATYELVPWRTPDRLSDD